MTGQILISNNNYFMEEHPFNQFLTKGKSYEVISSDEEEFTIRDDEGDKHLFDHDMKEQFFGCMVVSVSPAILQNNTAYEGAGHD